MESDPGKQGPHDERPAARSSFLKNLRLRRMFRAPLEATGSRGVAPRPMSPGPRPLMAMATCAEITSSALAPPRENEPKAGEFKVRRRAAAPASVKKVAGGYAMCKADRRVGSQPLRQSSTQVTLKGCGQRWRSRQAALVSLGLLIAPSRLRCLLRARLPCFDGTRPVVRDLAQTRAAARRLSFLAMRRIALPEAPCGSVLVG